MTLMGLNLCDRCAADCRHERNPNEIVVKCGAYKPPITNADRIRAMSDEELAREFGRSCAKGNTRACDKRCSQCWLEWLQKPAEEDT